jgi:hypothetical protein
MEDPYGAFARARVEHYVPALCREGCLDARQDA